MKEQEILRPQCCPLLLLQQHSLENECCLDCGEDDKYEIAYLICKKQFSIDTELVEEL